jgi:hypothetical protein
METWAMETWRQRGVETWGLEVIDMETWNTWRNGHIKTRTWRHKTKNISPCDFPYSVYRLLICSSCKWKFFVYPFVDEETNGSYPFANGMNRINGLS